MTQAEKRIKMGCKENISFDKFPKQNERERFGVGNPVNVCFHYDTSKTIKGEIVRSDTEDPFVEIIKLDDGRFVLSTECQLNFPRPQ